MQVAPRNISIRELDSQLEEASHCNHELALELEQMNAHSALTRTALESAESVSAQALHDSQLDMQSHQLEIQAIKQEAQSGIARLQRSFNATLEQKVGLLTDEMDKLRAQLASKSQSLEQALAFQEQRRAEYDASVDAAADLNRQLIQERKQTQNLLRQQTQLQDSNARLKAQLEEQFKESDAYGQVRRDRTTASPPPALIFWCVAGFSTAAGERTFGGHQARAHRFG